MLTQRSIRKSSLLLIYAMEMQHTDPEKIREFPLESYWKLVDEHELRRYEKILARAALHETRSLEELLATARARLEAIEKYAAWNNQAQVTLTRGRVLLDRLADIVKSMRSLRRQMEDEAKEHTLPLIAENSRKVINACEGLCLPIKRDLEELEKETHDTAAAWAGALRRVLKMAEGCAALNHPEQLERRHEHADLIRHVENKRERRPLTEELAQAVYARRGEWEQLLNKLLRNYVPARMNAIDRCILYLALYDLMYRKLDPGIVISEACILADEYSGGKSAPFIHGIIASAVMQSNPESEQPDH